MKLIVFEVVLVGHETFLFVGFSVFLGRVDVVAGRGALAAGVSPESNEAVANKRADRADNQAETQSDDGWDDDEAESVSKGAREGRMLVSVGAVSGWLVVVLSLNGRCLVLSVAALEGRLEFGSELDGADLSSADGCGESSQEKAFPALSVAAASLE